MDSRVRAGQEMLGQYVITSSWGCSTCEPQLGHFSGIRYGFSPPERFSRTGPSTWGMTSPARVTSTQSPSRMSLAAIRRSEEHTSELQSRLHLVCRLLLEKKKKIT